MRKSIGKNNRTKIIISVVIGIVITLFVNLNAPAVKIAFTEPATKTDYDNLVEYAIKEAQGVKVNVGESIEIEKQLEGNVLKIRVKNNSRLYGIEVQFPIIEVDMQVEDGTIEYKGFIDYDNAEYLAYTYVKNKIAYILLSLLIIIFIAVDIFIVLSLPKFMKKETKKII